MSFATCLAKLKDEGVIDGERAERFGGEYDRLNRAYAKTMGAVAAEDLAGRDALDAIAHQALNDRRQKVLQIRTQQSLLQGLAEHLEAGGKARHFLTGLMEHHAAVPGGGVAERRAAIHNAAWTRMNGFLERYNRDLRGRVRNKAELDDLVRALRGEKVESANAREFAAAAADTFEWLRQQFNLAGGGIAKLDNWGLPQNHDPMAVARAGIDAWKTAIAPMLDPASMIDASTGKAFADDEVLDEALNATYRAITSEGLDGAIPGAFHGDGKIANRRSDHRFLVFKDADAWLAYNESFGLGSVFDAITGHIDGMSRDIAAMQKLGPNPALTVRWLDDVMRMDAVPGPVPAKIDRSGVKGAGELSRMWRYYSGELTMPAAEDRGRAAGFATIRNWNTGAKLGSAFISAVTTDPMWAGVRAKFAGLPVGKLTMAYLKTFNPADATHRAAASSAGLVFQELTQRTGALGRRATMLQNANEISRRVADGVLRATVLTPHTVAAKQSIGLAWMGEFAEHAAKPFDALGKGQRLTFERWGIDANDWDLLRSTAVADDGVKLLRPGDLARRGDLDPDRSLASALKFFEMIDGETKLSIPGDRLRAQAAVATLGGSVELKRGTRGGELLHSATQFKTFSVIAMYNMMETAMFDRGAFDRRLYPLALLPLLIAGGTLSDQLLLIAQGKDPRPLDDPNTWLRGMIRGGGLAFAGDFAAQGLTARNSNEQTATSFFAGPTMSTFVDPTINLTLGNMGQAYRGEKTNIGREAYRQARGLIPGGNSWYLRLAANRWMLDGLEAKVDPDYRQSWRRMAKRAKEQRTAYWWAPGEAEPDRAPDLDRAFEAGEDK